jgi:hypothetical protein
MLLLARIISDPSAYPCAFNKLAAYLSTNHCLEILQFIRDASRYRACYAVVVRGGRIPWSSSGPGYENLRTLWEDLLSTYIVPNGHREVNLPSETRDSLLKFRHPDFIPHPSVLDDAIKASYELMEDSILPGFLDSDGSLDQPRQLGLEVFGGDSAQTPTDPDDGLKNAPPRKSRTSELCERTSSP